MVDERGHDPEYIGFLSICAYDSMFGGHAWLVYESFDSEEVFSVSTAIQDNVRFNFELDRYNPDEWDWNYSGSVYSLTYPVSSDQKKKLDEFIASNDHWGPFGTCAWFAGKAWNDLGLPKLQYRDFLVCKPSVLIRSIKREDGWEVNGPGLFTQKAIEKQSQRFKKMFKTK